MTDDITALIERLRAPHVLPYTQLVELREEAAEALSRLTAPLPAPGAAAAAAVCHDEQLEIWVSEFLEHLLAGNWLHLPDTYEETIGICACTKDAIKDLVEKAFTHPELTVSPPPEEIAGLLTEIKEVVAFEGELSAPAHCAVRALEKAAAVLERLVREVKRLEAESNDFCQAMRRQAERAAKLEEAAKAPLPEEIAGLVKSARARAWVGNVKGEYSDADEKFIIDLVTALERMGRENERLQTELRFTRAAHDTQVDDKVTIAEWLVKAESERDTAVEELNHRVTRMKELENRVGELEAERDAWKKEHATILDDINKYISESAIKAKTVEDCAKVADSYAAKTPDNSLRTGAQWIAEDIRALNQSQEKPTSD